MSRRRRGGRARAKTGVDRPRATDGQDEPRSDERRHISARPAGETAEGKRPGTAKHVGPGRHPGSGKPGPGRPGSGRSGSGKPGSAKVGSGKSGSGKPGSHRARFKRPAPKRPAGISSTRTPGSHPSGDATHKGCDHVFFIGFLGAGKTTVARNLGNMFHRRFVDVDRMVERELHATVTRIFATSGEDAFRDAETEALESLRERRGLLVSCGGGVIERPENARLMREMGCVVYLDGTLEDSLRQIRRPDKRPDLGDREHARVLYAHRRPLYEQACDYRVSISGKSFEEVAYEVGELLWKKGLL